MKDNPRKSDGAKATENLRTDVGEKGTYPYAYIGTSAVGYADALDEDPSNKADPFRVSFELPNMEEQAVWGVYGGGATFMGNTFRAPRIYLNGTNIGGYTQTTNIPFKHAVHDMYRDNGTFRNELVPVLYDVWYINNNYGAISRAPYFERIIDPELWYDSVDILDVIDVSGNGSYGYGDTYKFAIKVRNKSSRNLLITAVFVGSSAMQSQLPIPLIGSYVPAGGEGYVDITGTIENPDMMLEYSRDVNGTAHIMWSDSTVMRATEQVIQRRTGGRLSRVTYTCDEKGRFGYMISPGSGALPAYKWNTNETRDTRDAQGQIIPWYNSANITDPGYLIDYNLMCLTSLYLNAYQVASSGDIFQGGDLRIFLFNAMVTVISSLITCGVSSHIMKNMWVRPGNLKNGKWVRGEPKSMRLKWPAGWKFNNLGEIVSIPASLGQWLKAEFWDLLKEGIRDELILEEGLGYLVRIFGVPAEISDIISEAFGSGDIVRMRAQRASLVHNAQTVTSQTTAPSIQGVSAETEAAADTSINSAMADEHRQAAQDLEQTQLRTEEELAQIDSRIGEKQRELFRMYNHAQDANKVAFAKTLADIVNLKSLQKAQTFLRSQIELLKSGKFSAARLERAMDTKTFTMLEYGYQKRFPADTARHALRAINAIFATMQRIGIHEAVQTRAALVAQLRASGQEVPVKLTMQSFIDFMRQQFGADVGNTIMYTIDDAQGVHHGIDEVMAADIAVVDEWMDGGRVTSIDPTISEKLNRNIENLKNNLENIESSLTPLFDKIGALSNAEFQNKKQDDILFGQKLKNMFDQFEKFQLSSPNRGNIFNSLEESFRSCTSEGLVRKLELKARDYYQTSRKASKIKIDLTIDTSLTREKMRRLTEILTFNELQATIDNWDRIEFGKSTSQEANKRDFDFDFNFLQGDYKDNKPVFNAQKIRGQIENTVEKIAYYLEHRDSLGIQLDHPFMCLIDPVQGFEGAEVKIQERSLMSLPSGAALDSLSKIIKENVLEFLTKIANRKELNIVNANDLRPWDVVILMPDGFYRGTWTRSSPQRPWVLTVEYHPWSQGEYTWTNTDTQPLFGVQRR